MSGRLYPEPRDRTKDVTDMCVQCDRPIEDTHWRTSAGDPVHMMCARYVHGGARPCDDYDPED